MTKLEERQQRIDALADKLRQWREREAFSQTEAARALRLSQSFLSKVEAGKVSPDFLDVEDMASLYRKTLYEAVTLSERENTILQNYPRKPKSSASKGPPSSPRERNACKRPVTLR